MLNFGDKPLNTEKEIVLHQICCDLMPPRHWSLSESSSSQRTIDHPQYRIGWIKTQNRIFLNGLTVLSPTTLQLDACIWDSSGL